MMAMEKENYQVSRLPEELSSTGETTQEEDKCDASIASIDMLLQSSPSESEMVRKVRKHKRKKHLDKANTKRSLNDPKPKKKFDHTGKSNKEWVAGRLHIKKTHCLSIIISSSSIIFVCIIVTILSVALHNKWNCDLARPAHCEPPCPRLWIGYEGVCYFFSKEKRNWTSSQNFCISYNASLARIHNEEKDFLMRLKGKDIYWIGLQKTQDRTWRWTDGENATLEVTGDGGDCAYLNNDAEASSSGCRKELPWICRKSAASK